MIFFLQIVQIIKNPSISSDVVIFLFLFGGFGAFALDTYHLSIFFKWKKLSSEMKSIKSNVSGILALFAIMDHENFYPVKASLSKMLEAIKIYDDGSGRKLELDYLLDEYRKHEARDMAVGENPEREKRKSDIAKKLTKFGITATTLPKYLAEKK
jgi:hypothetical protein